jgi:hypothetical protein
MNPWNPKACSFSICIGELAIPRVELQLYRNALELSCCKPFYSISNNSILSPLAIAILLFRLSFAIGGIPLR